MLTPHRPFSILHFPFSICLLAAGSLLAVEAQEPSARGAVLAAIQVELVDNLPAPASQAPPPEHAGAVESAAKLASAQPDAELTTALLRYVLAYRSESSTVAARALGAVFVEQTDTFLGAYKALPALSQKALFPFLEFGFKKALEGKNKSVPKYKRAQRKFDQLHGYLMNLR